jgi:hypothetical protein
LLPAVASLHFLSMLPRHDKDKALWTFPMLRSAGWKPAPRFELRSAGWKPAPRFELRSPVGRLKAGPTF